MSIRFKLIASIAFVAILLLITSGVAFVALQSISERTRTIVIDRVEPMAQLKVVADMYAVNIVDTAHKIRSGAVDWASGEKALRVAVEAIDRSWSIYAATAMTDEEQKLADGFKLLRSNSQNAINALIDIVSRKDQTSLDQFVADQLYPTIDPLATPISDLVSLQLRVAQEEFVAANTLKSTIVLWMSVIAAASVIVVGFSIWMVISGVTAPLKRMQEAMRRLVSGAIRRPPSPMRAGVTRSGKWPVRWKSSARPPLPTRRWENEALANRARAEADRIRLTQEAEAAAPGAPAAGDIRSCSRLAPPCRRRSVVPAQRRLRPGFRGVAP
jgi:methyl-accepting chemotaxis protein